MRIEAAGIPPKPNLCQNDGARGPGPGSGGVGEGESRLEMGAPSAIRTATERFGPPAARSTAGTTLKASTKSVVGLLDGYGVQLFLTATTKPKEPPFLAYRSYPWLVIRTGGLGPRANLVAAASAAAVVPCLSVGWRES